MSVQGRKRTLQLDVSELHIPLRHVFRITRGEEAVTDTLLFRLCWGGLEGLGEAAPVARYGESARSVAAYFAEHPPRLDDPYALESLLDRIPPAARCGLDVALHDLIGKDVDRPLWRLFGLDPERTPYTSMTIGLDDVDTMVSKALEHAGAPILKIKVGVGGEHDVLGALRSVYTGTIRIDANEGWTPEQAVTLLGELARYDIEFCEQPIPAGNPERLRWVRERVKIPIIADEDAILPSDLPRLAGCVDGINIKLAKCGGIRRALEMIHTARALGLKVMLGSMVESAVLATAAAHLSPLVDWADIDGPLLVRPHQFEGVRYERYKLVLPDRAGLGILEAAA